MNFNDILVQQPYLYLLGVQQISRTEYGKLPLLRPLLCSIVGFIISDTSAQTDMDSIVFPLTKYDYFPPMVPIHCV